MFYRYQPVWALGAIVLGGLIGHAAGRLPVCAVARSMVAMVLAWHVGLLLVSFRLRLLSPPASEPGSLSRYLRRIVLTTAGAAVAGAVLHLLVSWEGTGLSPSLLQYRDVGMGMAGYVAGSIQSVVGWARGDYA